MKNPLLVASSWLTTLSLALVSRIGISQPAYGLAGIAFICDATRRRRWREVALPDFLYPLTLYALFSVLASAASLDPSRSLLRLKEMLLFGFAILLLNHLDTRRRMALLTNVMVASGVVLAVWGIFQYLTWSTAITARIRGPISHYMTYSGIILLCGLMGIAKSLYAPGTLARIAYGIATAPILVALLLTRTRSAYVGLAAAVLVLAALRLPRLLLYAPVVVVLILALAPPAVFSRIRSIFDARNETNVSRFYLWQGGLRMIEDYPLLGVGPGMVKRVYMGDLAPAQPPYRDPRTTTRSDAHLHDNVLQVAAERGLPALAAWLGIFFAMARKTGQQWRRDPTSPYVVAALLCLVAFHVAGLFEYNYGDSEVLTTLFLPVTLPYAEERLASAAG